MSILPIDDANNNGMPDQLESGWQSVTSMWNEYAPEWAGGSPTPQDTSGAPQGTTDGLAGGSVTLPMSGVVVAALALAVLAATR